MADDEAGTHNVMRVASDDEGAAESSTELDAGTARAAEGPEDRTAAELAEGGVVDPTGGAADGESDGRVRNSSDGGLHGVPKGEDCNLEEITSE